MNNKTKNKLVSKSYFFLLLDIPIFGIMTKPDLVDWKDAKIVQREDEFLDCLGIDSGSCYARWKNDADGEFTSGHLYFLSKLLSPDVRIVLDQPSILGYLFDCLINHPLLFISTSIVCFSMLYLYFYHSGVFSKSIWK